MDIITNADIKKFLTLVKAGLKDGMDKELEIKTNRNVYKDEFHIKVEFSFKIDGCIIDELFVEDYYHLNTTTNALIKDL